MPTADYAESLRAKLAALAPASGCYLFKDGEGRVVYVGKAKSLRSRVRSYFAASPSDDRAWLPVLRQTVRDLETVVTASEKEAAVLENELIKRHRPRFNVKLRDDKDFLCLRLDVRQPWPRLELVRRPSADGARYFGPYPSATAARRALRLVNKHFQLRTCGDHELAVRTRPCLQYQIQRCPGPCVHAADRARYEEQVKAVELLLAGRHEELSHVLHEHMAAAAGGFEYELAALYRDQLAAVESIRESQRVVSVGRLDQDVVGLHREAGVTEIVVLQVRQGHVTDSRSFSLGRSELPDEELLGGFLGHVYGELLGAESLPDELVLAVAPEALTGIADWLSERRGRRVRLVVPRAGARRRLLALATENAAHAYREKQRATDDMAGRLAELRERLRLPTIPRVIEGVDISHHGGGDAVGGLVCLRDGLPDKERYRTFRIHTTEAGDDYAAMYEVLARRFRRSRASAPSASGEAAWELPDLLVVDGGRGQLGVALAAARDLGLHELPIVALAKERETAAGETVVDRVYLPGQKNGVAVTTRHPAFAVLLRLRDEAHRFANRGRQQVRRRRELRSALDRVPGIGRATAKVLLRSLGSLEAVWAATDEQLLAVEGVTQRHVGALRRHQGAAPAGSPEPPPSGDGEPPDPEPREP